MQRSINSKVISGLNASGSGTSTISGGDGININDGVVSVDSSVATDTELATQVATKVSATDNNLTFSGTAPTFSNNLNVANKVLLGNNSGFGIVCLPERNNLTEYSYLFDTTQTLLNKKATGSGECSVRIANNNKIAVKDLAGNHANCTVEITPTSVSGSGLTVSATQVDCNEHLHIKTAKNIVLPAGSKISLDGTDFDRTNIASIATNTTNIATLIPFQTIWRYDTRVLLGPNDDEMWNDNDSVWLNTTTNTTEKLPSGVYTCKITTNNGNNNGNKGASENLYLWVFTGSFTHIKGAQGGAVNDFDNQPDIVEDVAQWWHNNEIGTRAFIVRKTSGSSGYMETHFRFTGVSVANSSYINLRFEMKRLW